MADLNEESLLELLAALKAEAEQPLAVRAQYITLTDDNLTKLGWSKEEISKLRELERTCLR